MNAPKPVEKVPARLLLQLREGILNVVSTFEIDSYGTAPSTVPGATTQHQISRIDIASELLRAGLQTVDEYVAGNLDQAEQMIAWARSNVERTLDEIAARAREASLGAQS